MDSFHYHEHWLLDYYYLIYEVENDDFFIPVFLLLLSFVLF